MKSLFALFTMLSFPFCAHAQFFGIPQMSTAQDVSSNGSIVAGENYPSASRWDAVSGAIDLGYVDSPGYGGSHVTYVGGMSADGGLIVGDSTTFSSTTSRQQAFTWSQSGGIMALGDTNVRESAATDVSDDGRTIVGRVTPGPSRFSGSAGVVWIDGTEAIRFSIGTSASGVSRNGIWVVGADLTSANGDSFRWSESTGMLHLGSLGSGSLTDIGHAVSNDGSVVVGQGGDGTPFRWTESGGMMSLGLLIEDDIGYATDTTTNGSNVVGSFSSAGAFIWTEQHGLRSLQQFLELDYGFNLAGWNLRGATAISGDGSLIAGYGLHNGSYEGFIAQIPEPSVFGLLLCGVLLLGTVLRRTRSNPIGLEGREQSVRLNGLVNSKPYEKRKSNNNALGDLRHSFCVLDRKREKVKEGEIANVRGQLATLASFDPRSVLIMEAGTHSPRVSLFLEDQGLKVIVANPRNAQWWP